MLAKPLPDLASWVKYLSHADIPVLRRTSRELARLREDEDNVTGRRLAGVILHDPLMTLRVLAYIEAHRRKTQNADITTIDHAVMMIGITPFFAKFKVMPVVEDGLKENPQALIGLLRVVTRARQSAAFARDWAVLRHDLDVDEVTVAALLHDAAEMLLWCFAPALMLQVRALLEQKRGTRSVTAQQAVLGVALPDLQLHLAEAWRLPRLLLDLMSESHAEQPRVRNVILAVNLARHAANGWDDPAIPDDLEEAARLLGCSHEMLLEHLRRVADIPSDLPDRPPPP